MTATFTRQIKKKEEEERTHNNTYKKLAVQWLNEALCPAWRDFMVAYSFRLRNHQLLVATKHYSES